MSFKVYIPARYASTRLPGKPLARVGGKTLIQHVYDRACASGAAEVVIATDEHPIREAVEAFGGVVAMTAHTHLSGTDRIAEAVQQRGELPATVIVNLQGDEPLMPAAVIQQVAALIGGAQEIEIGTICEPIEDEREWRDPNIVKVVRDEQARALYFSRAPIPHVRDADSISPNIAQWRFRHVGIYAYTVDYLTQFVRLPPSPLEQLERLEQLRALASGARIAVATACAPCGIGIDTPADLARFAAVVAGRSSH